MLSKGESFSYFSNQVAGRVGYVKMASDTAGNLLHVALSFPVRHPDPRLARAEVETGGVRSAAIHQHRQVPGDGRPALGDRSCTVGPDRGCTAPSTTWSGQRRRRRNNPVFSGGDVFVTWLMTGETRGYVAPGSVFTDREPQEVRIQRRSRRGRVDASAVEHRSDRRHAAGRKVLACHAEG